MRTDGRQFIPPVVFTLFAINLPSVWLSCVKEPKYEIVEEEVDVVVADTVVTEANGSCVEKEEVDITDRVTIGLRPLHPVRTLLLGTAGPSKLLSLVTVLVNAVLVAFIADRVYSEHAITGEDLSFVRIGYVSDSEAKFLVSEPDQSKMPVSIEIRLKDPEPPFDSPLWEPAGGAHWTDNSTDFTFVIPVRLRHPTQRRYEWRTSNNHSGEVMAAPKPGRVGAINNGSFAFVATSCMLSRVPYSPLDHPLAIPGARHLARVLPTLNAQFMLFLGDFIYVDVPRWWGTAVSDYRQKYRQVYASPDWKPIAQNLSWIHVLDDHEISNDWSSKQTGIYHAAIDPWQHYHAAPNPPLAHRAARMDGTGGLVRSARVGATYFSFSQGPASFFMLDTRSYRSSNRLPFQSENKTMLGAEQLADFLAFLRQPEPRGIKWKIVASSVPFTKNWHVNTRDTWGGFLAERRVLLEAMWDAGLQGAGVVILSGDRHEFAATRFPPPANSTRWPASVAVHEFSASPLNQFYSPIPSYFQWDDEDVKIRYINRGNSKFGVVTIPPDDDSSRMQYQLFVDGQKAWNTTVEAPYVAKAPSFWDKILGQ